MSTGDYVRFLRAVKGGATPLEIETATGVPSGTYRQIEQRYREVASEEDLVKLAEYFEIPGEDLLKRQQWTRKALSAALAEAGEQDRPLRLDLRTGESFIGTITWSDLGAVLLELEDGRELVVQRHMVDTWEVL